MSFSARKVAHFATGTSGQIASVVGRDKKADRARFVVVVGAWRLWPADCSGTEHTAEEALWTVSGVSTALLIVSLSRCNSADADALSHAAFRIR